jgi:hypothetical protein
MMRKATHALSSGLCLAWLLNIAEAGAPELDRTLQRLDSVAGRLQVAEALGTALALERSASGQCPFDIDATATTQLSAWLEQPSARTRDTSLFRRRREQVERIMGALIEVDPMIVCDAASENIPASLELIKRR